MAHIILLATLCLKEVMIYCQCVRRAAYKLKKEIEINCAKGQGYVDGGDDYYERTK